MNEIEATEVLERDNLAVIAVVESLEAIPGKDRVELVKLVDTGFTFICEKGHQPGDLVVYIKHDSIVPKKDLFSFMAETKYRVKPKSFTIRNENDEVVDKVYSQGIIISFNKFKHFIDTETNFWDDLEANGFEGSTVTWHPGTDVTKLLGVTKYIPPVVGSGSSFGVMASKGDFPTHIMSKTDELNLSSRIRALEELRNTRVYISLKIEGSSISCAWDSERDELIVCSRNNQIGYHETNKFWQAVMKNGIVEKLKANPNIAIQAELYGPGIQKNKLGVPEVDLMVYNVIDTSTRHRFGYYEMCEFLMHNEIPMVPIICEIAHFDWSFEKLQKYADIQRYANGELAEGIVVRPFIPFYSNTLKEVWSVKVLNREYKL